MNKHSYNQSNIKNNQIKATMDINASSIENKPLLAEVENDIQVENPLPRTNNNESAFRIWKNFICLCFVFALVFTSYLSLQNIESTLNSVAGLGITSLACVYLAVFISGIFAPVVVDYTSCKWVIVMGVFAQVVFVSSNFYPSWYTLVPASLFLGIVSSFFWTGQGIYLTNMAIDYSNIKNADLNQILTRFNGIFFFFFQSSQIFGNLISSLVLHAENGNIRNNSSPITNSSVLICGFHHCNKDEISVNSTNGDDHTSKDLVYILIGIYLALDVIALALTVIFLDNRPVRTERKKFKDSLSATLRFHKHKWILPLLPFFLFNGMEQGFLFSEYTSVSICVTFNYFQFVFYAAMCNTSYVITTFSMCSVLASKFPLRKFLALTSIGHNLSLYIYIFIYIIYIHVAFRLIQTSEC